MSGDVPHAEDLALAGRCLEGDVGAWEELVTRLQRPVHTLAVRFLWSLADAEDVTQEVLLKVLTVLHSYRGEASLTTWVYRVASRHLIDLARRPAEQLTFAEGRDHLVAGLAAPAWEGPGEDLLAEEVKIGCSTSMLLCLSRPLRLSYLMGAVLDLPGPEAAWVLDISPQAQRKRLSLARSRVRAFMSGTCGLFDPANPCRCARQIRYDVDIGRIDPAAPAFVTAAAPGRARVLVGEIEALHDDLAILRSNPAFDPRRSVLAHLRSLLHDGGAPPLI